MVGIDKVHVMGIREGGGLQRSMRRHGEGGRRRRRVGGWDHDGETSSKGGTSLGRESGRTIQNLSGF